MQRQMAVQDFPLPRSSATEASAPEFSTGGGAYGADYGADFDAADKLSKRVEDEASVEDMVRLHEAARRNKELHRDHQLSDGKKRTRRPVRRAARRGEEEEDDNDDEDEQGHYETDQEEEDDESDDDDDGDDGDLDQDKLLDGKFGVHGRGKKQRGSGERIQAESDPRRTKDSASIDPANDATAATTTSSRQNKGGRSSTLYDDLQLAIACALAFVILSIVPFEALVSMMAPSITNVPYSTLLLRTVAMGVLVFLITRFLLPPV